MCLQSQSYSHRKFAVSVVRGKIAHALWVFANICVFAQFALLVNKKGSHRSLVAYLAHGSEACASGESRQASVERQILQESQGILLHNNVAPETAHICSGCKFGCLLQSEGYLARSAFKLQELQQKHKLITPGLRKSQLFVLLRHFPCSTCCN